MHDPQIIATYEAILAITGQMLEAARNDDWARLVALERDCKELVDRLIADNTDQLMSGELQKRKVEIIRKVLADDAEIRNITQPWMAHLQNILGSASRERRVRLAYGPGVCRT